VRTIESGTDSPGVIGLRDKVVFGVAQENKVARRTASQPGAAAIAGQG
jgi:hypothetical protein